MAVLKKEHPVEKAEKKSLITPNLPRETKSPIVVKTKLAGELKSSSESESEPETRPNQTIAEMRKKKKLNFRPGRKLFKSASSGIADNDNDSEEEEMEFKTQVYVPKLNQNYESETRYYKNVSLTKPTQQNSDSNVLVQLSQFCENSESADLERKKAVLSAEERLKILSPTFARQATEEMNTKNHEISRKATSALSTYTGRLEQNFQKVGEKLQKYDFDDENTERLFGYNVPNKFFFKEDQDKKRQKINEMRRLTLIDESAAIIPYHTGSQYTSSSTNMEEDSIKDFFHRHRTGNNATSTGCNTTGTKFVSTGTSSKDLNAEVVKQPDLDKCESVKDVFKEPQKKSVPPSLFKNCKEIMDLLNEDDEEEEEESMTLSNAMQLKSFKAQSVRFLEEEDVIELNGDDNESTDKTQQEEESVDESKNSNPTFDIEEAIHWVPIDEKSPNNDPTVHEQWVQWLKKSVPDNDSPANTSIFANKNNKAQEEFPSLLRLDLNTTDGDNKEETKKVTPSKILIEELD
eukprot:TRINITY_DN32208_c0_g1_i1.p1 TRINITY_DN32208_c0_g1~~TRINITY_DN32208_c0_g1_i1.p1  ORF type:complete len:576 (-),score=169.08 TRINITY_DN32208_c0_g1_i1:119-1675(-)